MKLHELKAPRGSVKKCKRRGRGDGSGHGKTSCRGHKGSGQRSGTATHMAFEGGQMSIVRRLPKRGFSAFDKKVFQIVNTGDLNGYAPDSVVDSAVLQGKGMIKNADRPVKVLGFGDVTRALTVKANACSKSARAKIEQAGGKVEIVSGRS